MISKIFRINRLVLVIVMASPMVLAQGADALTFRQVNASKSEKYIITKTYVTDPLRNTVLIDLEIFSRVSGRLYVYYDPSLNNSGMHDSAWVQGDALVSVDGDKASALMSSCGFAEVRNGNLGGDFGTGRVNGNVVQIAELKSGRCTLALGFGGTPAEATKAARASLARGFDATRLEYEAGWQSYVGKLPYLHQYQPQFNMAAMVLKALEDKTFRGAVI